jgi:hypothetical protein
MSRILAVEEKNASWRVKKTSAGEGFLFSLETALEARPRGGVAS